MFSSSVGLSESSSSEPRFTLKKLDFLFVLAEDGGLSKAGSESAAEDASETEELAGLIDPGTGLRAYWAEIETNERLLLR